MPNGVRQRSLPKLDNPARSKKHVSDRSSSWRVRNLGPPPLFSKTSQPPRRRSPSSGMRHQRRGQHRTRLQRGGEKPQDPTAPRLGQLVQIQVHERPRSRPRLKPKHPPTRPKRPPAPHRPPAGPQAPAGWPAAPPLPSACTPPPPMKRRREHLLPTVVWTGRAPPPPQSMAAAAARDRALDGTRVWGGGSLRNRSGEERIGRKSPWPASQQLFN